MNTKSAAATLGVALLLAGTPALSSAAETQVGPIQIDSAQITTPHSDDDGGVWSGSARVAFTNTGNTAATAIVFDVKADGYVVESFNDAGSFAPGVTIRHSFRDYAIYTNQQIVVSHVTFADGSVWDNPDAPVLGTAAKIGT